MRLIADSGSTKVDWRAIHSDGSVAEITTIGINPFFQTEGQIIEELKVCLLPEIKSPVNEIYFYGAGVSAEKENVLKACLGEVFPGTVVYACTDMLGAARALCGREAGIAAILGTGSNSCFYDGKKIVDNVPACGFILGDEGSGAVIGKKFVSDYLKRQLPFDLSELACEKFGLSYETVVERVYKQPFANRYLASFSLFLNDVREHPYIQNLLKTSFEEFFHRNIMQYDYERYPVNLSGSIAYHYKAIIEEVAAEFGIKIGKVLLSPIEDLAEYHKLC